MATRSLSTAFSKKLILSEDAVQQVGRDVGIDSLDALVDLLAARKAGSVVVV